MRSALFLAASFVAMAGVSAPAAADDHERLVESFESDGFKVRTDNASTQVVSTGVTEGKRALLMRFEPANEDFVHVQFATPVDASDMGDAHLAFDVTNVSDVSVQFFIGVDASGGELDISPRHGSAVIAPGETKTFYRLMSGFGSGLETGLRAYPTAFQSKDERIITRNRDGAPNQSNIARISFRTQANPKARDLVLDNIRVRKNPAPDPFFLTDLVDEFGQADKLDFPTKIKSEEHLKSLAAKELAELAASKGAPERNKWGGWSAGPKLKATGYFRAEKVDGKWWMVDPEGRLFWSNALANVRMSNTGTQTGYDFMDPDVRHIDPEELTPEDSLGMVPVDEKFRNSRYLATPIRRNLFKWLPGYDSELGEHYGYRRVFHRGAQESGEIYSFYQANLERRYGEGYMEKWRDVSIDRMLDWGFPSFGNWVDPIFYQADRMPYFANGWIIGEFNDLPTERDTWSAMPDVFDPEFRRRARLTVEQIAREVQGSPWCVGVFVDNEKSWGRDGPPHVKYGIMVTALSQDAASSPAKAHYAAKIKAKYKTIAALNKAWGTDLASWEAFDKGVSLTNKQAAGAQPDLSDMLADYADTYFNTVHGELEKVMPDHMYMGVRMAPWGMPEEAVRAATKYTDVISFNNYKEFMHPDYWSFLKELDRPTLIGEFHIGTVSDSGYYHPGIIQATDQADRARIYKQYVQSVLDNPVMVGAHWFQYIDEPVTGRAYDGENYNIGFVTTADVPYPDMVKAAKELNYSLYRSRYEKK